MNNLNCQDDSDSIPFTDVELSAAGATVYPANKSSNVIALPKKLANLTNDVAPSLFSCTPAEDRPQINIAGEQYKIVDDSIAALIKTGKVFDRAGELVAVDAENTLHSLTKPTVSFALSRLINFGKMTLNKKTQEFEMKPAPVPNYVGDMIINLTNWHNMPRVDALTDHPILTLNNKLTKVGFDEETRLFGRFDPAKFNVPEYPMVDDIENSVQSLRRLLQTIEFETAGDEAAALCSMFTATSRSLLETAPITLIDAPMSGSGKGYTGNILCRFSENKKPAGAQLKGDDAEMEKVLISVLRSGSQVLFFDELGMSDIDCVPLRTFASEEFFKGRLLGASKELTYSTKIFALATGNNVSPTADMARRMLVIRLNPNCENPSTRHFDYDALSDVIANRDSFVTHVLTIQRAFLQAQAAGATTKLTTSIGSYKSWETLCRLPIHWVTGIDPCERMLKIMSSNPHKDELMTIMTAWIDSFGCRFTREKRSAEWGVFGVGF